MASHSLSKLTLQPTQVSLGFCMIIIVLVDVNSVYRITRMFCEHQTFANFARVDQFATIKSAKPKLLLVNTHDLFQNAIVKSTFLLIWLIRKRFSPAKYSSNTVAAMCKINEFTALYRYTLINSVSDVSSLSIESRLILAVTLTFMLTLVVGVSIGVLIVLAVNKCRKSQKITLQTVTEMKPPVAIYEDPDGIKRDPHTQGNRAYGQVQFS